MGINETVVQIAKTSFRQTLGTLSFFNELSIETQEKLQLSSKDYFSVMTTVSASKFRAIVLLHAPKYSAKGNTLIQHLSFDDKADLNQQYRDYTYEYTNNLCGMCARHIQSSGFTTGISQPAILNRVYTDAEIDALKPNYKAHVSSKMHGNLSLCSSICLFLNNSDENIVLNVESEDEFDDISGELEFF